jgi:hypothetical protein
LELYTATCGITYFQNVFYQGINATANISVCGGSNPLTDTTSGWVFFAGNGAYNAAYPAIVYLIEKDTDTVNTSYILNLLDSTYTDSNGNYQFVYYAGSHPPYLIKAALLPTNANYANVLPTYFDSSLTWDMATPTAYGTGSVNIFMIGGTNAGGPGFIGGSVLQGANKTTAVGDPLNKRIIILTTMSGQPVRYAYSDAAGHFSFSNLAYGSYKLFGDAGGKTHPALTVTISATQPSVSNVIFEENNKTFKGHIGPNGIEDVNADHSYGVYPIPVKEQLNITHLDDVKGTKTIRLVGVTGNLVYSVVTSDATVSIPASQLPAGVYSLIINSEEGAEVYKIIK